MFFTWRKARGVPDDFRYDIVYNASTFELIWPELATTAIILSGLIFYWQRLQLLQYSRESSNVPFADYKIIKIDYVCGNTGIIVIYSV